MHEFRQLIRHFSQLYPWRLFIVLTLVWGIAVLLLLKLCPGLGIEPVVFSMERDSTWYFISPEQFTLLFIPCFLLLDTELIKRETMISELYFDIRLKKRVLQIFKENILAVASVSLYIIIFTGIALCIEILKGSLFSSPAMLIKSLAAKTLFLVVLSFFLRILRFLRIKNQTSAVILYLICLLDYVIYYRIKGLPLKGLLIRYAGTQFYTTSALMYLLCASVVSTFFLTLCQIRGRDYLP